MPRVGINRRRGRQERVLRALTAAGVRSNVGMLPTIDLPSAGLGAQAFYDAALADGFTEATCGGWPCDAELQDVGDVLYRANHEGVYRLPSGAVARVWMMDTWIHVDIAAPTRAKAASALAAFQQQYPALFLNREGEDGIYAPVTFWMLGAFGPERRLRRIAATDWESVERNYSGDVRQELGRLLSPDFVPGADGQLLLWYGPPGTGKTWAIRALASEWSSWAEFHYVTDPDSFFVQSASYMVDVLLHESYEMIDEPTGDLVSASPGDKWRVLILEDTGELLSADAKDKSGQGLSRLLNVVDGMIGQGLRILVLVTTNDEIESLHPAVRRPGRCASRVVFGPLSPDEASEWAGEPIDEPMTLAELYARTATGSTPAFTPDDAEPLDDELEEQAVAFGPSTVDEETFARMQEIRAAGRPPLPADDELDPLTRAAVEAASAPLPELDEPLAPVEAVAEVTDELRAAAAADVPLTDATVVSALEAVAASHRTTVEAIAALAASGAERRNGATAELAALSASALGIIERLAARPAPAPAPAPDVHVHMPKQPLAVTVEGARVEPHFHVPEQPAPVVNVAAPETRVDVHVPEQGPQPIHVHVPEQQAPAPAPVHVDVHVPAARPRVVRVVEDPETGERSFVAEDAETADAPVE